MQIIPENVLLPWETNHFFTSQYPFLWKCLLFNHCESFHVVGKHFFTFTALIFFLCCRMASCKLQLSHYPGQWLGAIPCTAPFHYEWAAALVPWWCSIRLNTLTAGWLLQLLWRGRRWSLTTIPEDDEEHVFRIFTLSHKVQHLSNNIFGRADELNNI